MVGPGGLLKTAFAVLPLRASVLNARPLAFGRTATALSPNLNPIKKAPPKRGFFNGRTRRIRTADLYHVKVAL